MKDINSILERRDFIKFMGMSSLALGTSCSWIKRVGAKSIKGVLPQLTDNLILADGLKYKVLLSQGDKLKTNLSFGSHPDYIAIHPLNDKELVMWVNHEYLDPTLLETKERTKVNIDKELKEVGGSLVKLVKKGEAWEVVQNNPLNRGIRGDTMIPFADNKKVMGSSKVMGTLANCAGGQTSWGSFLTCEENYHGFYGERDRKTGKVIGSKRYKWETFYNNPPEHYGWVVEVDALTGSAKKHTSIGRFAHECATFAKGNNEKAVVYSADDKNDEHLYKFISNEKDSLDKGTLYVAKLETGEWLPLDLKKSPVLKKHFSNQLEVLTYARDASKILGATPLDRPEDVEINPITKEVFVTLTNNKPKGNFHGSILKIIEGNKDHSSLKFKSETFMMGGEKAGFSSPDNLVFDSRQNLWIANDISGNSIGKSPYKAFGNNGLFVIPSGGPQKGEVIQVASAPKDAELTGLCFAPDFKTLFVSVQHPGEGTKDINELTSTWPNGTFPKSSVVQISGDLLLYLQGLS